MGSSFKRGSEWRKWDLHIHTPFTKLNDQYSVAGGDSGGKWNLFCEKIEGSDVAAFGITDYFSASNYTTFIEKHKDLYPRSEKTFFPNVEFRMDSKNRSDEHIQCHVIFSNNPCTLSKLDNFFTRLKLVSTDNMNLTNKYCIEQDLREVTYEKAMVRIDDLEAQLKSDFSSNEYLIVGVARGYGSLRPGSQDSRGSEYAKELDKKMRMFFGSEAETDFYLNKDEGRSTYGLPPKPVVSGCDAHSFQDLDNKLGKEGFTWIKANPTFEGLIQTTYEPELRVQIQAAKPEDKPGYLVIERVEIADENIFNTELPFNSNLNSIIGGRSTGKSVLLSAIAMKLKTERTVVAEPRRSKYKEFVKAISNNINIFWKDGENNNEREVEFFQQGYMYELAGNSGALSELIQNILKQKGKEQYLNAFSAKQADTKKSISNFINDYFQLQTDIKEAKARQLDKGDKKGIEDEVARLELELSQISNSSISDEENLKYEKCKNLIAEAEQKKKTLVRDIEKIEQLKEGTLFKDTISYELTSVSGDTKQKVEVVFDSLKSYVNENWQGSLNALIEEINGEIKVIGEHELEYSNDTNYIKVSKAFEESSQLSELTEKIAIQKRKLFEITSIISEIDELSVQINELKEKILSSHNSFYSNIQELLPKLSDSHDGLFINAQCKFKAKKFRDSLEVSLNLQGATNQQLTRFAFQDDDNYKEYVASLFDNLSRNRLTLKGGYSNQSLANKIFSECFYSLNYDIEYEGDSFSEMSDGKKSFVVLKLLLDFSDKNCPILIDQPEDDLDNRSIFLDLVQYLKKKKVLRQIIVATHNPNIVVGTDSELVIVANQHGIKNENQDATKFEYFSGSIEFSEPKNEHIKEVLKSQGIREHVCEILEGGNSAFKLREKKYAIKD